MNQCEYVFYKHSFIFFFGECMYFNRYANQFIFIWTSAGRPVRKLYHINCDESWWSCTNERVKIIFLFNYIVSLANIRAAVHIYL